MHVAYLVVSIVCALLLTLSATGKLRLDPRQVKVIHETVGVPLKYFPFLSACELAAALGLAVGIWMPLLGIAAGIGAVLYFVGAIVSHLRAGDFKIGSAAFMLAVAMAALALRILTHQPDVLL